MCLLHPLQQFKRTIAAIQTNTPDSADLDQQLSLIASPNRGGETSAGEGGDMAACGAEMGACCRGGGCGAFADA
jgi:hypothetical protein